MAHTEEYTRHAERRIRKMLEVGVKMATEDPDKDFSQRALQRAGQVGGLRSVLYWIAFYTGNGDLTDQIEAWEKLGVVPIESLAPDEAMAS